MKSPIVFTAALSAAFAIASEPKVLNLKTARQPRSSTNRLEKRAGSISATLTQERADLYLTNITVGSPPQQVAVEISTGSSDLWVPAAGSLLCTRAGAPCGQYGAYNLSKSSTFKNLSAPYFVSYGDPSVSGYFATDNVALNNNTIKGLQFAVANNGSDAEDLTGLLGLGYESLERANDTYPNFISRLASEGVINSKAYSLWLNDPASTSGNILFGGIDTTKFYPPMNILPIVPDPESGYQTLVVPLTGIGFESDGQSASYTPEGYAQPAYIDSGTGIIFLPGDIVNATYKSWGATIDDRGRGFVDCKIAEDPNAKLIFTFNGNENAKIAISVAYLLLYPDNPGPGEQCQIQIRAISQGDPIILGEYFLRSAYVVVDLTNNGIGIAQAKYNVSDANILEISSAGIPSATVMTSVVSSLTGMKSAATAGLQTTKPIPTFAFTETTVVPLTTSPTGSFITITGTATQLPADATVTAPVDNGALSQSGKVGLGVGLGLGLPLVLAAIGAWWFFIKRRRRYDGSAPWEPGLAIDSQPGTAIDHHPSLDKDLEKDFR